MKFDEFEEVIAVAIKLTVSLNQKNYKIRKSVYHHVWHIKINCSLR